LSARLSAITPAERTPLEPLSSGQQRLWLLSQIEQGSRAYHVASGFRIHGPLNRGALRRALDALVARHEILRTRFESVEGTPRQVVPGRDLGVHWEEVDGTRWDNPSAACEREAREEAAREFELEACGQFRARLIKLADDDHVLLLTLHNIVCDGWAMSLLAEELAVLYPALCRADAVALPPVRLQYCDYVAWQRQLMSDGTFGAQAQYWRETLRFAPALLELPLDRPRPNLQDYAAGYAPLSLDEQTTAQLTVLAQRHGSTVYGVLLAAWSVVLSRLSGQRDIVIGSAIANRNHPDAAEIVGLVANTVALRIDLSGDPTLAMLIARTRARVVEAQRHQDLPFEHVVEIVNPTRSAAHTPLFQVSFTWQQGQGELTLPGLSVTRLPRAYPSGKFDLDLELHERAGRIVGGMHYASALFDPDTVTRHLDYLRNVLSACLADDAQTVATLPILPGAERQRVLEAWNDTELAFPRERGTHVLVEEQVARTPDAVALVFEGETLRYAELNARANRLAHHLRILGVRTDQRVAVCMERSIDMVVALLAVWKAGGAYLPLDPGLPPDRLAFMVADSAPVVLLTHAEVPAPLRLWLAARMRARAAEVGEVAWAIDIDDASVWRKCSPMNPTHEKVGVRANHLAYVTYTSGSTGQPKGVLVEHAGVLSVLVWTQLVFRFGPDDAMLQKTPFAFDASVWEIFWPISAGARLVIARPGGHKDPDYLAQIVREERITALQFVPSMLELFLHSDEAPLCSHLKSVFSGGERLSAALVERLHAVLPEATLYNLYGPTEASCNVTILPCAVSPVDPSVGRPVANRRIYILDAFLAPVPIGAVGEIYIGGVGVARGYLNLPELTAERFVDSPFVAGDRLYRTGDLGRYRADGNIEFAGRRDDQVKVSGFRVEVGEIESKLRDHPGIREAVVQLEAGDPERARLIAYYLRADGASDELDGAALRAHLAAFLPSHMIPSVFVRLAHLPLTPNGKLDRDALTPPEAASAPRAAHEQPLGPVEQELAVMFANVLGVDEIGRSDSFFELGGRSIEVFRILSQLKGSFGVKLRADTFFAGPTVEQLARAVAGEDGPSDERPDPDRTGGTPGGADRLNHHDEESHDDAHHVPALDPSQ
jgi:arthrofactin-type cyclic lipopeptide synthetase C